MELLIRFCNLEMWASRLIAMDGEVLAFCFHSLPVPTLCANACKLIELMLMNMDNTFDLCKGKGIPLILCCA
jgi:hypothetical protein